MFALALFPQRNKTTHVNKNKKNLQVWCKIQTWKRQQEYKHIYEKKKKKIKTFRTIIQLKTMQSLIERKYLSRVVRTISQPRNNLFNIETLFRCSELYLARTQRTKRKRILSSWVSSCEFRTYSFQHVLGLRNLYSWAVLMGFGLVQFMGLRPLFFYLFKKSDITNYVNV